MSHGTFEKIVIKVQKIVRHRSHFRLKTCPKIRKGILSFAQLPHPWGSPCTTQIVKQATLVFMSSINHHLE